MVSFDFLHGLGFLTNIRTGPHKSNTEAKEHITARGFVRDCGRFTIHADLEGECLGIFDNAGKLTGKAFDLGNKCEEWS
jgi:hypothetical protein